MLALLELTLCSISTITGGECMVFVRKHIHCEVCQCRKLPRPKPEAELQPLPCPARPFDRVGIDSYRPLQFTPSGNKWIIVATDHPTCYAETSALASVMGRDVTLFLHHGCPRALLTDRGQIFLLMFWKLCSLNARLFTGRVLPTTCRQMA